MTLGIEPDQRRVSPVRPLLAGDLVGGRRVAGFAWAGPPPGLSMSTHLDDRLLFDGDEHLPMPPDRPVPQTADAAEPAAPVPPDDLHADRVHSAASVGTTIPMRADALLDLPGASWQPVIRPLFAAVHATGHRLWLAGGAVRDVVAGTPLRDVQDLDLSGTVPPGRFTDITYQTLRAMRMSEFRTPINPSSLVCAVVGPKPTTRLFEYRGLSRGGFHFPVVGSRLMDDAQHRDFAFNALLYDIFNHEIFDPSGTGLTDLRCEKRRFTPLRVSIDPEVCATVIARAAKLALRWYDSGSQGQLSLDLEPFQVWISTLPADLFQALTRAQWNGLRSRYKRTVKASQQHQHQFAVSLPEPGRGLIERLIGGVR